MLPADQAARTSMMSELESLFLEVLKIVTADYLKKAFIPFSYIQRTRQ